ncbi:MAG TPA: S41 family peptidase [Terriglobia bacterium]|nr:S41 family peptidase [Terriglobia bacterium]
MKSKLRGIGWIITSVVLSVAFCPLFGRAQSAAAPASPPQNGAVLAGPNASAGAGTGAKVGNSLKTFSEVYGLIEQNYADPVPPDLTIYGPSGSNNIGAIPAMLRTLDPHSNFFDPTSFAKMQEEMRGDYYGVGMEIAPRPDKAGKMVTIVEQPLPDSPAFNAGLRPGDTIVEVDGKSTATLDSTQVADMLRGPRDTMVSVTVTREGVSHPLSFTLKRQKITQPSVDTAFMIRPDIAYIRINTFNETTNPELTDALNKLGQQDFKGLILDLRENRGGLLNQAVGVASHFLRKNQLIVYHNGRSSPEQKYYAETGEEGPEYPIIVLTNNNTASAAEIVTGALQDHDRALVMGQRSFGKGLVQTEYPLSNDTMLLLTTAHYYTPSGRLIQRDYSDISLYDYYNHYDPAPLPHTQARLTDGGREVFGGGGITPDIIVSPEKLNPTEEKLVAAGAFFDFGGRYLADHKTISEDFKPNGKALEAFRKFLASDNVNISAQDLKDNEEFIRQHIQEQLVRAIDGSPAADQIAIEDDPLVGRALDSLPQAKALLVQAQRYMAERGTEVSPAVH